MGMGSFEAEKSFGFFFLIYVVVTWLFLNRGPLEETILVLFTGVMIVAALALIARFVKFLAKAADSHDGNYGSLFVVYLFNLLLPLAAIRFFGDVLYSIVPCDCSGFPELMVDLINLFLKIYNQILHFPRLVDWLIIASLSVFSLAAIVSVGLRNKGK